MEFKSIHHVEAAANEDIKAVKNSEQLSNSETILNASLEGKTRSELSPEQREAEDRLCRKRLETFLTLVEEEKIWQHTLLQDGTKDDRKGDKNFILDVLEDGIRPRGNTGDNHSKGLSIKRHLDYINWRLKGGIIDDNSKFIKQAIEAEPRTTYFYERVFPKIEQAYKKMPDGFWKTKDGEETKAIVSKFFGYNLISVSPAKAMKRSFLQQSYVGNENMVGIFFDAPGPRQFINMNWGLRNYEDYTKKKNTPAGEFSLEYGVANKISSNHFRAIKLGNYDLENRTWNINKNFESILPKLIEMQNDGVILLDANFRAIPNLNSISLNIYNDKESNNQTESEYSEKSFLQIKLIQSIVKNKDWKDWGGINNGSFRQLVRNRRIQDPEYLIFKKTPEYITWKNLEEYKSLKGDNEYQKWLNWYLKIKGPEEFFGDDI